jgi:hypothetical protein
MLTLFACPKPFTDPHIALIQRNAITSWTRLYPKPQILLFGDEAGIADICKELNLTHISAIALNSFGTPLLNWVFAHAERLAAYNLMCYVNADILLMSDFGHALEHVAHIERFLMGGAPWGVDIDALIDFELGWELKITRTVETSGKVRPFFAADYFVYPKGLWGQLPPFILGRGAFDNALLFRARNTGAKLIDATYAVTAVHQNHAYPVQLGGKNSTSNAEAMENRRLAGGSKHLYSWRNATHRLTQSGLKLYPQGLLCVLSMDSVLRLTETLNRLVLFPYRAIVRRLSQQFGRRK